MKQKHEIMKLKVNLGMVFRGEISAVQDFLGFIHGILNDETDVEPVYQSISASKLWIKEGENKND